jgi:hypothetical protein
MKQMMTLRNLAISYFGTKSPKPTVVTVKTTIHAVSINDIDSESISYLHIYDENIT